MRSTKKSRPTGLFVRIKNGVLSCFLREDREQFFWHPVRHRFAYIFAEKPKLEGYHPPSPNSSLVYHNKVGKHISKMWTKRRRAMVVFYPFFVIVFVCLRGGMVYALALEASSRKGLEVRVLSGACSSPVSSPKLWMKSGKMRKE